MPLIPALGNMVEVPRTIDAETVSQTQGLAIWHRSCCAIGDSAVATILFCPYNPTSKKQGLAKGYIQNSASNPLQSFQHGNGHPTSPVLSLQLMGVWFIPLLQV